MGWLFADKILRIVVNLLIMVWLARYLGPAQFGILNYSIAFVALFSTFALLGLEKIVVRELVGNPGLKEEILGTVFMLRLFGGVVAVILTVGTISLVRFDDSLTRWMVGIISLGMLLQTFDTIDCWFQSQVQSKYTVYAKGVAFIIANLGKVALIIMKAELIAFAWIGLAEMAIGAVGMVVVYRVSGFSLGQWKGSFERGVGFLKDSWPLILSGLTVMVYMRIDQIMIGEMLGDEQVGIYSSAVRLSEAWYFMPMIIVSSIFPSILQAKTRNQDQYLSSMQKLYYVMSWISISIAIPATFLRGPIINVIYGEGYRGADTVLAIHIWAGVFVYLGVASSQYLLAENLTRISFYRTLGGAVVNVLSNLYFIPRHGINGAAMATLISYGVATFGIVFPKRTRAQFFMILRSLTLLPLPRSKPSK